MPVLEYLKLIEEVADQTGKTADAVSDALPHARREPAVPGNPGPLITDIPGVNEPKQQILFAQTREAPKWSRIEWAQQLLLHAYTRTSPEHSAPVLTAIGYINWWEGKGSKAHQFLQLALNNDPAYRLGPPQRPNDRRRPRRRLEHEQRHRVQSTALRHALRHWRLELEELRWPYFNRGQS